MLSCRGGEWRGRGLTALPLQEAVCHKAVTSVLVLCSVFPVLKFFESVPFVLRVQPVSLQKPAGLPLLFPSGL